MGLLKQKDLWGCALITCSLLSLVETSVGGSVVLIGRNVSYSFLDVEANFAPSVKGSGEYGVLYVAEPLDACDPLTNEIAPDIDSPFVLIIRGGCTFDAKVRNAQNAGFKAAIVYDDEDRQTLISMAGNSIGIHIPAVFVSMASGEILKKYAGCSDLKLWIIPTFENSAWAILVISFIALLVMSIVLAACFFIRSSHLNREQTRVSNIREFHGMSRKLVKAMPSLIFTSVVEDNCTSMTCAICLEDYIVGEKLRVLPCRHNFHALCVDYWLTTWRSFCPVCKQDAMQCMANRPASEFTPLLTTGAATPPSNVGLSSFHSNLSPAMQRASTPPISLSNSRSHSFRSPPIQIAASPCQSQSSSFSSVRTPTLHRSYGHSPVLSSSRSSVDHRNASMRRSHSHLVSVHYSGIPIPSSINSRLGSSFIHGSSIGSPNYFVASSSQQSYLRHCSESGSSLSALASAQSLPEC